MVAIRPLHTKAASRSNRLVLLAIVGAVAFSIFVVGGSNRSVRDLTTVGRVSKGAFRSRVGVSSSRMTMACGAAPQEHRDGGSSLPRRSIIQTTTLTAGSMFLMNSAPSMAKDSVTASRSPGLGDVDEDGFRLYTRPYGASASGGMRAISQGKGNFPPYSFKVPDGWKQKAVSVADPSGPETDSRFTSPDMGDLLVVLPPVFTFIDDEDQVDTITIDEIAPPMKLLPAFAPQALGIGIEEDGEEVSDVKVVKKNGLTYYNYEVRPHSLVSATVYKGHVYVLAVKSTQSQWGRYQNKLKQIIESFEVVQS